MDSNVKNESLRTFEIINTDQNAREEMKEFENIDIIIKNILNIGNGSTKDLINLIIIKSNNNKISIFEFVSILKLFWKNENLKQIINIFLLPFYIFNAEDELSKKSYNYYCCFNIKQIIFNKLGIFELSSFYNDDDKKKLKITCKYNIEKMNKIQEINITPIVFFIIFYFPLSNKEKLKYFFMFFDYENNGKLYYGKKKLFLTIRYIILISIFYPDIFFNYYITEFNKKISENNGDEFLIYNKNDEILKNKKEVLQNINDSFWDFKKILLYIKNTKGVMKQLIQYMTKKLLYFEKLGQTVINKNEFIDSINDYEAPVANINIIRSIFFDFIYNKISDLKKFLNEFDILLNTIQNKINLIENDENIKSMVSSECTSDQYSFDKNIKEKLLNCCDKIFILAKNNDLYKKSLTNNRKNKKKPNKYIYEYPNEFNNDFLHDFKDKEHNKIENKETEKKNVCELNEIKFEGEVNYNINDDMDEYENSSLNYEKNNVIINQNTDMNSKNRKNNIFPVLELRNIDNNTIYESENENEEENYNISNYLKKGQNNNSYYNNNTSNEKIKLKNDEIIRNSNNNNLKKNNIYSDVNTETYLRNNPESRNLDNRNNNISDHFVIDNNNNDNINKYLPQNQKHLKGDSLTDLNIFTRMRKNTSSEENNSSKKEIKDENSEKTSIIENYEISNNDDSLKIFSPKPSRVKENIETDTPKKVIFSKKTKDIISKEETNDFNNNQTNELNEDVKNNNKIKYNINKYKDNEYNKQILKSNDNGITFKSNNIKDISKSLKSGQNKLPKVKKINNFFKVDSLTKNIYNKQANLNSNNNINSSLINTQIKNNLYYDSLILDNKINLSNGYRSMCLKSAYNISPYLIKYFEEFHFYENLNEGKIISQLKKLNPKLFNDLIIKKFTPFLSAYVYENIIEILKGQLSVNNLNLYLVLMDYYNKFLINKKECNQKIFFLNSNFYSKLKNINISQYDYKIHYDKILNMFEDDIYFEEKLIFDMKNAIIIVPINTNGQEKEFTYFKIENSSKNITVNKNINLQDINKLIGVLSIFLQYANSLKNAKFTFYNYKIVFDNSINEWSNGKMRNFYLAYYSYSLNSKTDTLKIIENEDENKKITKIIFKQIAEFFIGLAKFINETKNK